MREKLIALIEEQADFRPVTEETTFEEMGMDSLDFMLLIQDVRSEIGTITDEQVQKLNTVGDLLRVLNLAHLSA